jgi:hypothetical protein
MPSSLADLIAERDLITTHLLSAESFVRSGGSDGASLTREDRASLAKRRDMLDTMIARRNGTAPMITRGRLRGL